MNNSLEQALNRKITNDTSEKTPDVLDALSGQEALNELIDYFLGEDWYVVDPLGVTQINAIAVDDIKCEYRSKAKNSLRDIFKKRKIHYGLKPLSGQEGLKELINYFLGEDWYIADHLGVEQVNAIAVNSIKRMYKSKVKKYNSHKFNIYKIITAENCAIVALVCIEVFIFCNDIDVKLME